MTIKSLHGLRLIEAFDKQRKIKGKHDAYCSGGRFRTGAWGLR